MHTGNWEVMILKPTHVFLAFLAAQLPEVQLPELSVLQADATAYTIRKHNSEEEILDEIERHFPSMFRHEIARWLGENVQYKIEGSFLDFLCCFKFELHSRIVLMEPTLEHGHQLIKVQPKTVLLKWMKTQAQEHEATAAWLHHFNLPRFDENTTVVVKNFNQQEEIKNFVKQHFNPIFKSEMERIGEQPEYWPTIDSFETFSKYFSIGIHSQLVHLH